MNPAPDFSIPRGDTPALSINLNNLWTISGSPFMLTFTAKGDLDTSTTPIIQKTLSGITPTLSGVTALSMAFTAADTTQTPGTYYYDFKLVNANDEVVMHTPLSAMQINATATL